MFVLAGGAVPDDAHQGGFGDDGAIDGDDAGHFADGRFFADHRHFDSQLVAGADGAAEFRAVDGGEKDELLVAIGDFFQDQNAGHLGHAFGDEDAGHGRLRHGGHDRAPVESGGGVLLTTHGAYAAPPVPIQTLALTA